ncbi:uncharacterized protein DUF4194 [Microcella alkaliphila]|uniref:Uncharacterized protein DUF4194 n=1 Tax=Microcella alkaliphila TaxID=279828 RepID=A0A4Q7TTV9_9MICO|nr:DUF4194 domain-containing protein [Microcella alkaliphila]RZT64395.1 uncharacterized protein DUF4194 [Microcella alkaliphila]
MTPADERAIATAIIHLMKDVVYRDVTAHEAVWHTLERHRGHVADHFRTIGIDVVIDETEGYAYLATREPHDSDEPLPRLVRRHSLTYNVSLLLVLLRKRLAEFEADGDSGTLVVTRDQLVDMIRVFHATTSNEARSVDQADTTIKRVVELGFLRELRAQQGHYEVRRILKAYVDAHTLGDFANQLAVYATTTSGATP